MASYLNTSSGISNTTADLLLSGLHLAVLSLASAGNVSTTDESAAVSAVTLSVAKLGLSLPRAETLASVLSTLSSAGTSETAKSTTSKPSGAILDNVEGLTTRVASQVGEVSQTFGDLVVGTIGALIQNRGLVDPGSNCKVRRGVERCGSSV